VATLVARNANEAMVALAVGCGGVCVYRGSGVRRSVLCWFGRNLDSVAVKTFSHEIYLLRYFYEFCVFNVICKDNITINCITVQRKKSSFPSSLTGHTQS
jgi:hypothetical protein